MFGNDDMHEPDLIPLILMDEDDEAERRKLGGGSGPAPGCSCALLAVVGTVIALSLIYARFCAWSA